VSNSQSLMYILPELVLLGTAVLLVFLEAVVNVRSGVGRLVQRALPLLGVGVALALIVFPSEALVLPQGTRLFFGMLAQDPLAIFFRGLVMSATAIALVLAHGSPSVPKHRAFEFQALVLLLCVGMCMLAGANHLLMIYVALESVSLVSYALAGFDDRAQRSGEAGLKYVLFGGVASALMLFGLSMIYGLFGELSLEALRNVVATAPALASPAGQWAALVALVFVIAGFGFKIAAVPFHMWCPDVYEGAPTPFAALLSVGPKAVGFAVLLRFGLLFWSSGVPLEAMVAPTVGGATQGLMTSATHAMPWLLVLGVMSTLTMTLGNLAAIMQDNLKRLLAYSSIAHAGYLLMGVVAGGKEGFTAVVMYLAIYVLMNIGAFAVVSVIDRSTGSEDIAMFRGLAGRAPLLALVMAVFLFSLTGLPPTAGFVGKLYLFVALIKVGGESHGASVWYIALALVGVVNSVVSLYFYARVLRAMYIEKFEGEAKPVRLWNAAGAVAVALAVPTLVFGIFWEPLAVMARTAANVF